VFSPQYGQYLQYNGEVTVEIVFPSGENTDGVQTLIVIIEGRRLTAVPSGSPFAGNPQHLHSANARLDRHSDDLAIGAG